jgi:hypothetical protein
VQILPLAAGPLAPPLALSPPLPPSPRVEISTAGVWKVIQEVGVILTADVWEMIQVVGDCALQRQVTCPVVQDLWLTARDCLWLKPATYERGCCLLAEQSCLPWESVIVRGWYIQEEGFDSPVHCECHQEAPCDMISQ